MPWFSCFQSFGIFYLQVGLSLSWEVLCMVWKDYYVVWFPLAARRRGVHIANVIPGPRPRTGFGGGDVEHCLLLWWYAVGTDQAKKAPRLVAHISEPVHWKWKKKNVGLSSVMSELKLSTLQGFYTVDHDFLGLPQLLKTFLQSWLPHEADKVGAGSSCSTSWYFWDASVNSRPSWS